VGRTPSGRQVHKDYAHVSSAMHATPFLISDESKFRARDVVSIGKGVNSSAFITRECRASRLLVPQACHFHLTLCSREIGDGQVFEWSFTTGVERLEKAASMRVASAESGFRYHLMLAQL
jgi:hypothetical protein